MQKKQAARQRFTAGLALAALVLTIAVIDAPDSVVTNEALADTRDADFLVLDPEGE